MTMIQKVAVFPSAGLHPTNCWHLGLQEGIHIPQRLVIPLDIGFIGMCMLRLRWRAQTWFGILVGRSACSLGPWPWFCSWWLCLTVWWCRRSLCCPGSVLRKAPGSYSTELDLCPDEKIGWDEVESRERERRRKNGGWGFDDGVSCRKQGTV